MMKVPDLEQSEGPDSEQLSTAALAAHKIVLP